MATYKNLKAKSYSIIKQKILNNELKPSEYLEEKMLCEMLGISRTPIRSAITLLEWEGLVKTIPNKGIFVTDISVQAIKELFQVRHLLEPMILRLSHPLLEKEVLTDFRKKTAEALAEKNYVLLHQYDYEFHNYISSKCSNRYLIKMMGGVSDNFQRVRTQDFYTKERTETGAQEHLQLIDLLMENKTDEAVNLMEQHISSTEHYFFKSLI